MKMSTQLAKASLDKAWLLGFYRTMQLIRRCEEQLASSQQRGLVHGACDACVEFILLLSMIATRFFIIPSSSSFFILLKHGVVDRPTFLAIVDSGRLVSVWRIDNIFLSIKSIL